VLRASRVHVSIFLTAFVSSYRVDARCSQPL